MIRLFRVSIPTSLLVLVLADTVILTACYVGAMFLALNVLVDPWFYLSYENGWLQVALVVSIIQIGLYMMDLYDNLQLHLGIFIFQKLCLLVGVAFLGQAIVGYSKTTALQLPQWTMLYGSLFVLLLFPLWRSVFLSVIQKGLNLNKVLFIGMSPSAQETVLYLENRRDVGFEIAGYIDDQGTFSGAPYMGNVTELSTILGKGRVNTVVISQDVDEASWLTGKTLLDLRAAGIRVEGIAKFYEMMFGRVSLSDLRPSEMLLDEEVGLRRLGQRFQSLFSGLLGWVGLVICAPVMLAVAVLVRLSSPGPALYSQKRVGKNGVPFSLYKFRSMYIDAEERTGPVWATKNDPRITPVGRWLRLLRLDELPQFFNVIRGEMALVGPRPERPEFCEVLEKKIPFYNQRHIVKPGITGWAQINHKYTETIEDTATKLEFDLYYVKHRAPALDAYIIFHTVKVMVRSRGAQ